MGWLSIIRFRSDLAVLPVLHNPLPGRDVRIELRFAGEHADTGKGFDNGENLGDLRLEADEGSHSPALLQLLAHHRKNAQTGAADELQTGEVKHEVLPTAGHHRGELLLQIRCGQGIEAAGELYGVDSRLIGAGSSDDLNIKWHDGLL